MTRALPEPRRNERSIVPDLVVRREGRNAAQPLSRRLDDPVVEEVGGEDALRWYRLAVARAARHFKNYPPVARERGWEGIVRIGVKQNAGGGLPEVILLQSSGHHLLDAHGLEMISKAVQTANLPEELLGRSFQLSLPVRYALAE